MKEGEGIIDNIPTKCPKCGKELKLDVIELKHGGFLYLEYCSGTGHYRHYREPTWGEVSEFNA